ncbi:MAG: SEC-C domain-containing protein [Chlorobiaceae bacterium]|nr:SEC-C domain-containing protein [Chlorobiaceae bacterium]
MINRIKYYSLPCPCGSGKSFDECCFRPGAQRSGNPMDEVMLALKEAQKDHQFSSMKDAEQFMQEFMIRRNTTPRDEFAGLSPSQMRSILYTPFGAPGIATFADILPTDPCCTATSLFKALAEAIGDKGLKPTAAGNLPRNTVRDISIALNGTDTFGSEHFRYRIQKEADYFDLQLIRFVAGFAGLIKKHKGHFILTGKCRTILDRHGMAGIWPELFRAYAETYNWACSDGYGALHLLQHSFLYTLYLLHRFGLEERDGLFYANAFLRAFPAFLDEISPMYSISPEEIAISSYLNRVIDRFAGFFGLAHVEKSERKFGEKRIYKIRALPLLDQAIHFHIP